MAHGSCWAFSTVGSLEGRVAIAAGNLQQFSELQFVDGGKYFGVSDLVFWFCFGRFDSRHFDCPYDEAVLGKGTRPGTNNGLGRRPAWYRYGVSCELGYVRSNDSSLCLRSLVCIVALPGCRHSYVRVLRSNIERFERSAAVLRSLEEYCCWSAVCLDRHVLLAFGVASTVSWVGGA